jgi:hypothetical protein
VGIVVEELDESDHWLTLIVDAKLAEPPPKLRGECRELRALLATSCATARRKKREAAERKKESREKRKKKPRV